MHTIDEWLASLGLSEYSDKFHAHGIDVSVLPDLTESDLVSIGVLLGHRRKILKAVTNLRTGTPIAPTADTPGDHVTSSERRQLTVMFCDMVGSTALSAQLDPEDMRQIILDYQSTILDTVTQFHGVVARQMGDGVLVYFGYPHAEEDYAEQSIHAGLALINAFKNSSELSPAIRIRIGIATGTVVVGAISIGEHNTEQAVVGDTPNLAARLQSIAEPGSMLVCENTYRLAKGHFHFTKITPAFLRGWDNPVPAWRAVEPKRIESRFEASHETKLPPLVGREEEVELLSKRWKQTMGASGRVVTLLGEPGIGKSHVVLSFADRIQSDHHHALRYFCSPHHTNSALFPVISQIERAATFEPTDPPDVKLSKLINWLGTDIEPSDIALVAYLLHLETDDTYQVLDILPQQRKANSSNCFSNASSDCHYFTHCSLYSKTSIGLTRHHYSYLRPWSNVRPIYRYS